MSRAGPPRKPDVGQTGEHGRRSLAPAPQRRHAGGEVNDGLDRAGQHGEPANDDDEIEITDDVAGEIEMENAEHAIAESERVRYSVSGERSSGPTPSQSAINAIADVGMTTARKATLIMPPMMANSHARSLQAVCCCTPEV